MEPQNQQAARKKRAPCLRPPSPKYMALQECADYFRVNESTVRKGLGVFSRLTLISTGRRTLVLRSSVEKLDRALESAALVSA